MSLMSEGHWWYLFHKYVKDGDSIERSLNFDNLKLRLGSCIFNCISWLNPNCNSTATLYFAKFFYVFHTYSLRYIQGMMLLRCLLAFEYSLCA